MSVAAPEPSPGNAMVKFDQSRKGAAPQWFQASRTDVLLVLKFAGVMHWGWLVEFAGTERELIAAGIATPCVFQNLGKTGQKTGWTPYGVQYTVKKRKACYELVLRIDDECRLGEPADPSTQKTVWWRKRCGN